MGTCDIRPFADDSVHRQGLTTCSSVACCLCSPVACKISEDGWPLTLGSLQALNTSGPLHLTGLALLPGSQYADMHAALQAAALTLCI